VVSTPVGCAGLGLRNGADVAICADWAAFGAAICELLASPTLRRALGAEGRRTVEHRYSWTAIAEQAYASYLAMVPLPHPLPDLPPIAVGSMDAVAARARG